MSPAEEAEGIIKDGCKGMGMKDGPGMKMITPEEREYGRGVKRWRYYKIEDGAAWSEQPILETETYRGGLVFQDVESGPQLRSARRPVRRVKQKLEKYKSRSSGRRFGHMPKASMLKRMC